MFMIVGRGRDSALGTIGGPIFDRHKGSVSMLTAFWGCSSLCPILSITPIST